MLGGALLCYSNEMCDLRVLGNAEVTFLSHLLVRVEVVLPPPFSSDIPLLPGYVTCIVTVMEGILTPIIPLPLFISLFISTSPSAGTEKACPAVSMVSKYRFPVNSLKW